MKELIYLCAAILLLSSCGNQETQRKKQWEEQLKKVEQQLEKERQDSIKQAKDDSLALFAWGSTKFGMTKDELLSSPLFKDASDYDNHLRMDSDIRFQLSEAFGLKEMCDFDAYFKENELYSMEISSFNVYANHIDDLVHDCDVFIRNFSTKMGKVTYYKEHISISDFNEGDSFYYAALNLGSKTVMISLAESYSGGEFCYKISIFNSEFPRKKHVPTEEELKNQKEEQIKKEIILNNSF